MVTRSARLFSGFEVAKAAALIYECPSDRLVILKSIVFTTNLGTAADVLFYITDTAGTQVSLFIGKPELAQPAEWNGWVVLEPHCFVGISYTSGTIHFWGSGAILPPAPD